MLELPLVCLCALFLLAVFFFGQNYDQCVCLSQNVLTRLWFIRFFSFSFRIWQK